MLFNTTSSEYKYNDKRKHYLSRAVLVLSSKHDTKLSWFCLQNMIPSFLGSVFKK